MRNSELWRQPVTRLGGLMARQALSPVELLEACLERCDRLNPSVNAIVAFDRDDARLQAHRSEQRMRSGTRLSVLDGIPVTVKDNLFARGFPATWGSRLFAEFKPEQDDLAVASLRAAGAIIVGKTNTPEFALASHTDNLLFGKTRNPWDLALTPGGSSGGAAAAISAGMIPLALGTDAGGSIRRPAGYTGIVGIRPSTGRIPRCYGFPSLAHDFQAIAPAARTVDDLYALFRIVAHADTRDRASLVFGNEALPAGLDRPPLPRLRIRYAAGVGDEPVDREIRDSMDRAAAQFAGLGHDVRPGPAPFDLAQVGRIWSVLSPVGVARVVSEHPSWRERVSPAILTMADAGQAVAAADYVKAIDDLQRLRASVAAEFENFDVLLTAASAAMPWPVTQAYPSEIDGRPASPRGGSLFSTFVNAAGLPAMSLPAAPSSIGLPIGLQLVGRFGADLQLFRLARQFERAHPWANRWPSLAESC